MRTHLRPLERAERHRTPCRATAGPRVPVGCTSSAFHVEHRRPWPPSLSALSRPESSSAAVSGTAGWLTLHRVHAAGGTHETHPHSVATKFPRWLWHRHSPGYLCMRRGHSGRGRTGEHERMDRDLVSAAIRRCGATLARIRRRGTHPGNPVRCLTGHGPSRGGEPPIAVSGGDGRGVDGGLALQRPAEDCWPSLAGCESLRPSGPTPVRGFT